MKTSKQGRAALDQIASNFPDLSEPTRLVTLQELKTGPITVNELVDAMGLSQANVSKQLGIVRNAGFLACEQRGTSAPYSISEKMVMQLCALVCDRLNRQALAKVETFSIWSASRNVVAAFVRMRALFSEASAPALLRVRLRL